MSSPPGIPISASNGVSVPGARNGAAASPASESTAWCYTESIVYDQSYSNIPLTVYQLSLQWSWDYTQIDGIWQGYEGWNYDSDTGWELDYHDSYLYQPDYDSNGYWVNNGEEGWAGFSEFGSLYQHEHHIIMWIDSSGGCWGDGYFWGSIPGWSYEEFYSWTE